MEQASRAFVKLFFHKLKSSMFWHILISVSIMLGLNITILIELSKHLLVPQPLPIFYNSPREPMISLAKTKNDHSLNWIDALSGKEKFYLAYNEGGSEETNMKKQIYILKSTLELNEKYKVNHQLQHQLGHFVGNANLPDGLVIEIKKRRSNQ